MLHSLALMETTILALQGDRVLVHWRWADGTDGGDLPLTFIHVVDVDHRELRLVNRDEREHEPDWLVKPELLARIEPIEPAEPNQFNCKWKLRVKE